MKNHDITKIEDQESFIKFLINLEQTAFFSRDHLEGEWRKVEAAINQQFVAQEELLVARSQTGSPSAEQLFGEELDAGDLEMRLYIPLLARMMEGWVGHLRRVGIPVNRQFFRVKFDYRGKLSIKFPFLVSIFEDAWQDFYTVAFNRIKAISKLTKGQKQTVTFGNTVLNLDYDKDVGLIDTKVVNIRNFALYPPKDDPSRSNMIVKSTVPIGDLEERLDIPDNELEKLLPEGNVDHGHAGSYSQGTDSQVPFGQVEIWTYFIPYYKDYKKEELTEKKQSFKLRNAIVLLGVNKSGTTPEEKYILLKVFELDNREQNPLLFSTFGPTLPNVPYDRGKLPQYIPYQALMNLLSYGAARGVAVAVDPPLLVKSTLKGTSDSYQVAPGVMWPVEDKNDISQLEIRPNLDHFLSFIEWVEKAAAKGIGITELLEGAESGGGSSRKTATQSVEERKSGEVRIDYIAEHQNDNYFQPFVYKYGLQSQLHMQIEVESAKEIWNLYKEENPETLDDAFWSFATGDTEIEVQDQTIINPCPLYRNFLTFSNIRQRIDAKQKEIEAQAMLQTQQQSMTVPDMTFAPPQVPAITEEELYEAIIDPILSTNIIVEGSTGEITKREQRQDFLDLEMFFERLDTPTVPGMPSRLQSAGLYLDPKEVAKVASKLFNMPSVDLVKPIGVNAAQGTSVQQPPQDVAAATSASPTEEGRNTPIEEPGLYENTNKEGV